MFVSETGRTGGGRLGRLHAMTFRELHFQNTPLVLPNAWDAVSARLVERSGARAVATTSAGVAWSLGVPDGDQLSPQDAVAVVARVVRAVDLPVTADIEAGYGDVASTVKAVLAAGAAGVNIEDGPEPQVRRFAQARAAGDGLFVNARIETFLFGVGGVRETVARAHAYLEAGVDGIFVPGVTEPDTIAELVERIPAPLNVMAGPGAPPVAELAALGVRRVSVGAAIAVAAYEHVAAAATEILTEGTYEHSRARLTHGDLNSCFAHPVER